MNTIAIRAIFVFEMARFFRTIAQSLISPVLSTSLYFVVFGAAIGSRIQEVEGVSYGAFIVRHLAGGGKSRRRWSMGLRDGYGPWPVRGTTGG